MPNSVPSLVFLGEGIFVFRGPLSRLGNGNFLSPAVLGALGLDKLCCLAATGTAAWQQGRRTGGR